MKSNLIVKVAAWVALCAVIALVVLLYGEYRYFRGVGRGNGPSTRIIAEAIYEHLVNGNAATIPRSLCSQICRESLQKAELEFGKVEEFRITKVEVRFWGIPVKVTAHVKREKSEGLEELYKESIRGGIGPVDVLQEPMPSSGNMSPLGSGTK